jgi:multicomponent Na+:H+ antiporter subunit B
MNSVMFQTAAGILKPIMLLFAVFLFLRGHNAPGGGFVAGLVAASGFCLDAFAYGAANARRSLGVAPQFLIAAGLIVALFSGIPGLIYEQSYLTGLWGVVTLPVFGEFKLGTPLFFDAGVFMVVLGVTLLFILTLLEERH